MTAQWGPPPTPGRWLVRYKHRHDDDWTRLGWYECELTSRTVALMQKETCIYQHAPLPTEPEEHGLPEGAE